jgi:hypothetical protein
MGSTDKDRARSSVDALFEEIVAPLAQARRAAGLPAYFPLAGEAGAKSYFQEPALGVMRPEDFQFPGDGTAEGLIDALAAS